jgi:hypothetical protein
VVWCGMALSPPPPRPRPPFQPLQFNTAVRKAFVQMFDFKGMKLVDALRCTPHGSFLRGRVFRWVFVVNVSYPCLRSFSLHD